MTYDARSRERWRWALNTMTALGITGVLSASGWLAGHAAADQEKLTAQKKAEEEQAAAQQRQARARWVRQWKAAQAAAKPRVVWKNRKVVTVVDTRVVHTAAVGTGGTVHSTAPTYSSGGGTSTYVPPTSSGGVSHAAPAPAARPRPVAPPPPPPPPRPAPRPAKSSGS